MKILFTGASSHTGYWFVKELVAQGHEVTATFTKNFGEYEGIRKRRVMELQNICKPLNVVSFGDKNFLKAIKKEKWDLLCHHGAELGDYRSDDYNVGKTLSNNTLNVNKVLNELKESGCGHVLLTGTVFEPNEGAGTKPLKPIYLYGLAKHFTWEVFKYLAELKGMVLGKYVMPNTFGPMEDHKFTGYLIKTWYNKEIPTILTPDYVRDNIHVSLSSKVYVEFAEKLVKKDRNVKISPSQYSGKQGEFAKIFAQEMEPRLNIPCPLNFNDQKLFPEPRERVNTDKIDPAKYHWDKEKAWSDIANFYIKEYI